MTAWTVITELEIDDELLARARDALRDAIVEATGVRPRTKTIRTSAFNAALHPPRQKPLPQRGPDAATPLWEGPVLR